MNLGPFLHEKGFVWVEIIFFRSKFAKILPKKYNSVIWETIWISQHMQIIIDDQSKLVISFL
jgi:hypothetical protein